MSDYLTNSISVTTVHLALQQLLESYLSEKEESRMDNDTQFIGYWDSACQTIYDVAAALNIPFGEQPSKPRPYKQHPHQPDSLTPLRSVDIQLTEGV